MIPRKITTSLKRSLTQFPIVSLTGPRQSGKTTLLRNEFPDYSYVLLEDPDVRAFAQDDPRAFLMLHANHVIFDEVQRVPELFSYLQGQVDETGATGQYILSGSQNFLLMDAISQSLAGRVAIKHLPPLSYSEVKAAGRQPESVEAWVVRGGYPRLYDVDMTPAEYYSNYIQTYIDRDVTTDIPGVDKVMFADFIRAAACRSGQMLNLHDIAGDVGVSDDTAKRWMKELEKSGIVFFLHPYSNNLLKRTIKTPKMYFFDTGLVSYLTRYSSPEILMNGAINGAILENYVVSEIIKTYSNSAKDCLLHYYRDKNSNEIDLIMESDGQLHPIEIKKSINPPTQITGAFKLLDKASVPRGTGAIICLRETLSAIDSSTYIVPVWMI